MGSDNPFWYTGNAYEVISKALADQCSITWEDSLPEDNCCVVFGPFADDDLAFDDYCAEWFCYSGKALEEV